MARKSGRGVPWPFLSFKKTTGIFAATFGRDSMGGTRMQAGPETTTTLQVRDGHGSEKMVVSGPAHVMF